MWKNSKVLAGLSDSLVAPDDFVASRLTVFFPLSGIIAVEPEGGKEARAHAVSGEVEAHNVYLPQAAPWVHDFIEECAAFPTGAHDDQVDAMTQRRPFDIVLVARFDRFARSTKHLVMALEEFNALGIDFISLNECIDTSTPMGKMIFTIIGAVAQLERKQ